MSARSKEATGWLGIPRWAQVTSAAHRHLPWFIFLAVLAGVVCGWQFRSNREPNLKPGGYDTLNNESRRGKNMPVLVMFRNSSDADRIKNDGRLETTDDHIEKILIPDELVLKTYCNASRRSHLLEGKLDAIHRTDSKPPENRDGGTDLAPATLNITGRIVSCENGRPRTQAEGLALTIHIGNQANLQPEIGTWVSSPAISIMDGGGTVFRQVLLMIFLPLLAITFIRTPLEGKIFSNIRQLGAGLLIANIVVAIFGLAIGAGIAAGMRPSHPAPEIIKAQLGASDGATAETPYDAHPAITTITKLVPSNPLGSLGDASGTNAMQILLLAGTIGLLLSFAHESLRGKAAEMLKQGAAFLVRDQIYSSKSLMDFVQPLIPVGVFCLTATLACTMQLSSVKEVMGGVLLATVLSQVAVILTIWLAAWYWRRGEVAFRDVIRLSWPGIATAGATMSSFAALPELFTLPFIKESNERRALLNLGIALNKLGATAYLAAAASFIAFMMTSSPSLSLVVWILLFSVVTPIFAGGVPFAAVFALGLVLQYTTPLSGPAWWVMTIEPLLDPIVTMVNVVGNLFVCTHFTRVESEPQENFVAEPVAA